MKNFENKIRKMKFSDLEKLQLEVRTKARRARSKEKEREYRNQFYMVTEEIDRRWTEWEKAGHGFQG
ncbi:hypothetical protein [Ileibacterium valens]|uniref:hypothetical protein n=1 Tax=Ileibacterium valens TaxID=1862668 RepID=UPI00272A8FEF|nr:hypothetical protein [Ileibacterium valens]